MIYLARMDPHMTVMVVGLMILVTSSASVIHSSIAISVRMTSVKIASPNHGRCAKVLARFAKK